MVWSEWQTINTVENPYKQGSWSITSSSHMEAPDAERNRRFFADWRVAGQDWGENYDAGLMQNTWSQTVSALQFSTQTGSDAEYEAKADWSWRYTSPGASAPEVSPYAYWDIYHGEMINDAEIKLDFSPLFEPGVYGPFVNTSSVQYETPYSQVVYGGNFNGEANQAHVIPYSTTPFMRLAIRSAMQYEIFHGVPDWEDVAFSEIFTVSVNNEIVETATASMLADPSGGPINAPQQSQLVWSGPSQFNEVIYSDPSTNLSHIYADVTGFTPPTPSNPFMTIKVTHPKSGTVWDHPAGPSGRIMDARAFLGVEGMFDFGLVFPRERVWTPTPLPPAGSQSKLWQKQPDYSWKLVGTDAYPLNIKNEDGSWKRYP